jgi:hypothetical protein
MTGLEMPVKGASRVKCTALGAVGVRTALNASFLQMFSTTFTRFLADGGFSFGTTFSNPCHRFLWLGSVGWIETVPNHVDLKGGLGTECHVTETTC